MLIENVGSWDNTYDLYKASYKGLYAYGASVGQAIGNLLGVIQLNQDNWKNYLHGKI